MRFLLNTLIAVAAISTVGFAQRHRMPGDPEMREHGRLEKFKMMRLVEVLKLNEEDAVRLYAKNSAHEDKVRELMKSRNSLLDDIEGKLDDEKETGNLKAVTLSGRIAKPSLAGTICAVSTLRAKLRKATPDCHG
ncbi:MAG: hypothetical protein E6K56_04060 [Ignavibacteria bacterium]|nr:MAG: hypothetical protein E6K56_04060 [Ignavibacteria bacterium]